MLLESSPKISLISDPFTRQNLKVRLKAADLVIPGAEKYLLEGVSDLCAQLGVACFGPSAAAARLEGSKRFAKEVMLAAGVPTARYIDISESFERDLDEAISLLQGFSRPVIKVSGPALGKGVFVCQHAHEAETVLRHLKASPMAGMEDGLIVEEAVRGEEVSLFFACQGEEFSYLGAAQDHKRLLDQDQGPNTGGMGTISPVSWVSEKFITRVTREILQPTLRQMQKLGTPFKGVLFLGLMVEGEKLNLLEYNVRFGDRETQVLMPLLQGDLTRHLFAMGGGEASASPLRLKTLTAVHVVKAARGYPGTFGESVEKGKALHWSELNAENEQFFFAGVETSPQGLMTSGGRVLGLTAWGEDKLQARERVYRGLSKVSFEGEQFRTDIGARA
jgi:phosphoribosylamine--glycine ligase